VVAVADLHHDQAVVEDVEELDRLVLKALRAPLDAAEAARLDGLVAQSAALALRAEEITRSWMLAGLIRPEAVKAGLPSPARRWVVGAAVAAGAAAVVTPAVLWRLNQEQTTLFQAPSDGPLRAKLADGTLVTLSRTGRLEARLGQHERNVRLIAGQAFFTVAHRPERPFRVTVGDHLLTVLGTQFNVNPDADGLRVDLLEGALRVETLSMRTASVVLKPGQRYWADHSPAVTAADVASAANWVNGRLVFDDAALKQVAADLFSQTGQVLEFDSPKLAALRFSGVLNLQGSADWKSGLEAVLPIRVLATERGYRVVARR
jgi:transmembrane sensor